MARTRSERITQIIPAVGFKVISAEIRGGDSDDTPDGQLNVWTEPVVAWGIRTEEVRDRGEEWEEQSTVVPLLLCEGTLEEPGARFGFTAVWDVAHAAEDYENDAEWRANAEERLRRHRERLRAYRAAGCRGDSPERP